MDKDGISRLIADLGPALDFIAIDCEAEAPFWRLAVDSDLLIYAELDPERDVLMLYAEVGPRPAEDRLGFYELALRYHFAWDAFEGARLSLDEDRLWFIEEIAAPLVAFDRLKARIENFIRRFHQWRELARNYPLPGEHEDPLSAFADPNLLIRG